MLTLSRSIYAASIVISAAVGIVGLTVAIRAQQQHPHHDVYKYLYDNDGTPCCGGNPINGDCEPVGNNYKVLLNGDVVMLTRRYGSFEVHVAREKVIWMTIEGLDFSVAHWCGKPRNAFAPGDPEYDTPGLLNPDPAFYTTCAIVSPGSF